MKKILIAAAIGSAAILFIGMKFYHYADEMEECQKRYVGLIPGPKDLDVNISEEFCWGIGGSDAIEIVLFRKNEHRGDIIFSYGRKDFDKSRGGKDDIPHVAWIDPNHIRIAVDAVSDIPIQQSKVRGVNVEYRIGSVEYR